MNKVVVAPSATKVEVNSSYTSAKVESIPITDVRHFISPWQTVKGLSEVKQGG